MVTLNGAQVEGRQHRVTVAAVNARGFNMLHHTHYVEVLPVKDGVYFGLLATVQEVVDQDLVTGQVLQQAESQPSSSSSSLITIRMRWPPNT